MKKQSPYAESVDVLFLIRQPGTLEGGRVSNVLLGTVDLLPTLVGLLGQVVPDGIDGHDLSAALRGDPDAYYPESALLAHYLAGDKAAVQGMPEWRGVRTHQHTYVERADGAEHEPGRGIPWLLFDNDADPYQQANLVEQAQSAPIAMAMRARLAAWLSRTNDSFRDGAGTLAEAGLTEVWEERQRQMRARK